MNKPIELLSPSGNSEIARGAIMAGCDAIYIGAKDFGARKAASNSVEQIADVVGFAHSYGVKVYVTLNTILFDDELKKAEELSHNLYQVGVDALIIQDMAFLKMNLPPIALHASTQMFSMSVDKVKMLEELGFSRVVLERAMTLREIENIARNTSVELEAFIHGAICVSYSGQCYLGQVMCERGGNRGNCAQACRSWYNLTNKKGDRVAPNGAHLAPRDMNLGSRIEDLINAGVSSLKIEGRLKDLAYVINNTAYYNDILKTLDIPRSSQGVSTHSFEADPGKSFTRGFTTYYLDSPTNLTGIMSEENSSGEYLGVVDTIVGKTVKIKECDKPVNNGDGVCWNSKENGEMTGSRVNIAQGGTLSLNSTEGLSSGMTLFRNFDNTFNPTLKDLKRVIDVDIDFQYLTDSAPRIQVEAMDGYGSKAQVVLDNLNGKPIEGAVKVDSARENIINGLSKSAGTIFNIHQVRFSSDSIPFLPQSVINSLREQLLAKLLEQRLINYQRELPRIRKSGVRLSETSLDFRWNVSNHLSEELYRELGAEDIEPAIELGGISNLEDKEILRSRFCIRREKGLCPYNKTGAGYGVQVNRAESAMADGLVEDSPKERQAIRNASPLYLENNGVVLEARFYCEECIMGLYLAKGK